jgi:hypothetical protein
MHGKRILKEDLAIFFAVGIGSYPPSPTVAANRRTFPPLLLVFFLLRCGQNFPCRISQGGGDSSKIIKKRGLHDLFFLPGYNYNYNAQSSVFCQRSYSEISFKLACCRPLCPRSLPQSPVSGKPNVPSLL